MMCVSVNSAVDENANHDRAACVCFDTILNLKCERLDIFVELPESRKQCENRF